MKYLNNRVNWAFTLAEVLVTLGIIGVVAALTIPSLVSNTKKSEVSARLKRFNSIMSQVMIDSERVNGMAEDWFQSSMTAKQYFDKYIEPFLKYTKIEDYGTDSVKVYLADGTSFWIYKGGCMDFKVDINADKAPNVQGRDQFTFLQCQTKKDASWCDGQSWCSYRKNNTSSDDRLQACKDNAIYCSGYLETQGWEIPDDYPYRI